MIKKARTNSGFTLIELILVIAIIALLAAASIATLSKFNRQQNLNIDLDELQNTLAEAKSLAAANVVTGCKSPTPGVLVGYQVTINPPTTYSVQEVCQYDSNPAGTNTPIPAPAEKIHHLHGSTFTSAPPSPNNFVRFIVLSGGVSAARSMTIRSTSGGGSKTINVTSDGVINVAP